MAGYPSQIFNLTPFFIIICNKGLTGLYPPHATGLSWLAPIPNNYRDGGLIINWPCQRAGTQ